MRPLYGTNGRSAIERGARKRGSRTRTMRTNLSKNSIERLNAGIEEANGWDLGSHFGRKSGGLDTAEVYRDISYHSQLNCSYSGDSRTFSEDEAPRCEQDLSETGA